MGRLTKSLRFEILARDGFRCVYCGAGADVAVLHVDHRNPTAKGGGDDRENLVTACEDCNSGKSDRVLIPARTGYDLSKDMGPGRIAKARAASPITADPNKHWVTSGIKDVGDRADGDVLVLVRCETHQRDEWLWIDEATHDAVECWGAEPGWITGAAVKS